MRKTPKIANVKIQADNLHLQALLHGNDAAGLDALAHEIPALAQHASASAGAAAHRDPGENVLAADAWSDTTSRALATGLPTSSSTLDAAGLDRLAARILAPLS